MAPADRIVVLFEHDANRRLLAEMLGRLQPAPSVPDGDRHRFFCRVLADDIPVEFPDNFPRRKFT